MNIEKRKSFVQIGIGIKKEPKNDQGMHIKKKGKEPKIQTENSTLFESQLRSPIDLIKN